MAEAILDAFGLQASSFASYHGEARCRDRPFSPRTANCTQMSPPAARRHPIPAHGRPLLFPLGELSHRLPITSWPKCRRHSSEANTECRHGTKYPSVGSALYVPWPHARADLLSGCFAESTRIGTIRSLRKWGHNVSIPPRTITTRTNPRSAV